MMAAVVETAPEAVSAIRPRPQTRICLLGSEASGKTCFVAALCVLTEGHRKDSFQIMAANDAKVWLNALARELREGRWPPATSQTRRVSFDLLYRKSLMRIEWLDYRGEEFRRSFHESDEGRMDGLRRHLESSDFVLLMIDPTVDLAPSSGDRQSQVERADALLQVLLSELKGSRRKPRHFAILLSKSDTLPEQARLRPQEYLQQHAPGLLQKFQSICNDIRVFAVSAVGDAARCNANPPEALQPLGYEPLFDWIVDEKRRDRRRPWVRSAAALCALMLVLAGAWNMHLRWALTQLVDATPAEILRVDRMVWFPDTSYMVRLTTRIVEHVQRIGTWLPNAAPDHLERLSNEAEQLSMCRHTDAKDEVNTLRDRISAERESRLFNQVKHEFESNVDGFRNTAERYLETYPQSPRAKLVQDWLAEHRKREESIAREKVRKVTPSSAPHKFLERKADAIEGYLDKHRSEDAKEQERAAKLARQLSTERTYTVRLKACGRFSKPRDHMVKILADGEKVREFDPPGSTSSSTWPKTDGQFQLTWKPSRRIRVELLSLDWINNIAATLENGGPLSLSILGGRRDLVPDGAWTMTDFDNQPPYIEFEIEGYTDEDWRILQDWVEPGSRW